MFKEIQPLTKMTIDDDVAPLYSEGKDLLMKFKQADRGGKRELIESVWKLLSKLSDAARGCHREGRLESAYALYKLVLMYSRVLVDKYSEGQHLNNLGMVCRAMKRYDEALKHFSKALKIAKAMDSKREEAAVLGNLGLVYLKLEQHQEALDHLQQALQMIQGRGNTRGEAIVLHNIGDVHYQMQRYQEALEYFEKALTLNPNQFASWYLKGCVQEEVGNLAEAKAAYQRTLALNPSHAEAKEALRRLETA